MNLSNNILPMTTDRAILDSINRSMCIVELAMDGTVLRANDNFLKVSGYDIEDLEGKNHRILCSIEYAFSNEYHAFWDALHSGKYVQGLFPRQKKDGNIFWVEATYSPVFSSSGEPEKIIKICTDVTQRNETAKEDESKKGAILQVILVAEYTLDGTIINVNDNFTTIFGFEEIELLNKNRKLLYSEAQQLPPAFRQTWDYVLSGRTFTGLVTATSKNGTPIWLESIYIPIRNLAGSIYKIAQYSIDVSWRITQEALSQKEFTQLAIVADKSENGIIIADEYDKALFVSESFTAKFGFTKDDLTAYSATRIFGPGERDVVARSRVFFDKGETFRTEEIAYSKSGQRFWVSIVATPVLDEEGRRENVLAVIMDITDIKMHQVLQDKALEAMAKDVPLKDVLTLICLEVEQLIPEVVIGIYSVREDGMFESVAHPRMPFVYLNKKKASPDSGDNIYSTVWKTGLEVVVEDIEAENVCDYGKMLLEAGIRACWVSPIKSAEGRVVGLLGFYYKDKVAPDEFQRRIAVAMQRLSALAIDRENNRKTMRKLTYYDSLTGLPNRSLLLRSAEHILDSSRITRNTVLFMTIGLDKFSVVVDNFGTEKSNEVIFNIAARLKRQYDETGFIARMPDGVFILVMPGVNPEMAADVAERVQQIVSEDLVFDDISISPRVSVGISVFPEDGEDVESLLQKSSIALSESKNTGVGFISFFNEEQNERKKSILSLEASLKAAINSDEMMLVYQPQVSAKDKTLHGAEALSRWNSKKHGMVSPDRFIPLIEGAGLMLDFSRWVLDNSCKQLAAWRRDGVKISNLSINLSPSVFQHSDLIEIVESYTENYGLVPADIILELTEGVFLNHNPIVMENIDKAAEKGFKFSMDDFGTGYSSLNYLRRLPITELKLDKSFVNDLVESPTSRKLSKAVISIGKSLDLSVVAEGVETEEQYELLKDQGYDVIQGYFFSKPLAPMDFMNWALERQK